LWQQKKEKKNLVSLQLTQNQLLIIMCLPYMVLKQNYTQFQYCKDLALIPDKNKIVKIMNKVDEG